MRKFTLVFVAAFLLLGATQCKKEKPDDGKGFRLTAYIGAEGEKTITHDGIVSWSLGDIIYIYNTEGQFVTTLEYSGSGNEFTGQHSIAPGTYNFFFLGRGDGMTAYTAPQAGSVVGSKDFSVVGGHIDGTLADVEKYNVRVDAGVEVTDGTQATAFMENQIAIACFDLSWIGQNIRIDGSNLYGCLEINFATGECTGENILSGGQDDYISSPIFGCDSPHKFYFPIIPTKAGEPTTLWFSDWGSDDICINQRQYLPGGIQHMLFEKNKFYKAADGSPINVFEGEVPLVTGLTCSNVTSATADVSFTVAYDTGNTEPIMGKGICWSTEPYPAYYHSHIEKEAGAGEVTATISGLQSNTTYYVRPYAYNFTGYSYGTQQVITTGEQPTGSINALFSVSATEQVYFSQGNLQCRVLDATTDSYEWRFAENQWDYVGAANANISATYTGWFDLLGWGTSGYNHGAVCYQPYSTSTTPASYYAYGSATANLCDGNGTADWGYNRISNGGDAVNQWRTLTKDEWLYVISYRTDAARKCVIARIETGTNTNTRGLLILPDLFVLPSDCPFTTYYEGEESFEHNSYNLSQWDKMQAAGAVFLPFTGSRSGTSVYSIGVYGEYWTVSSGPSSTNSSAYCLDIDPQSGEIWVMDYSKSSGHSVRLVKDKN